MTLDIYDITYMTLDDSYHNFKYGGKGIGGVWIHIEILQGECQYVILIA